MRKSKFISLIAAGGLSLAVAATAVSHHSHKSESRGIGFGQVKKMEGKPRKHPVVNRHYLKPNKMVYYPYQYKAVKGSYWQWAKGGALPEGAKVVDFKRKKPVYLCRVNYLSQIRVGKLEPGKGCMIDDQGEQVAMQRYLVMMR